MVWYSLPIPRDCALVITNWSHCNAWKAFCELYNKENISRTRTMGPVEFPTKNIQQDNGKYWPHTGGQRCKNNNMIMRNIGNTRTMGCAEFPDSLLHPLQQLGGILWAIQLGKYQPHAYVGSSGIEHTHTTGYPEFLHSLFTDALVANFARITTW